jgi:TolA-binding protein
MNAKLLANMDAWNKTNVFFYDRSKMSFAPVTTAERFLALGDSLAKNQKFDGAVSAYNKIVDLFAERDTLFRTAVYNMAQTYSDAQKYKQSVACFEAFLQVWPDAPEAEKALFSLGFVLNENLKQNDRALEVLEDFQKRFPKSELKESVDWLVENIKSDGKLADDLMKKIEAEE